MQAGSEWGTMESFGRQLFSLLQLSSNGKSLYFDSYVGVWLFNQISKLPASGIRLAAYVFKCILHSAV